MKSTGLFGKNSGRVGGVVYSSYRGEQIVRAYQPKVSNPSTRKQVEQRAKFKLVSQVGASLGKEIAMSFVPSLAKETPRNAFVKEMLKKTVYSKNQAVLPIEDIVLTNSRESGVINVNATAQEISGMVSNRYSSNAKLHYVLVGYNEGGEISIIASLDAAVGENYEFTLPNPTSAFPGYSNIRALLYVYDPITSSATSFEDYAMLEEDATLKDYIRVYARNLLYSETTNVQVPRNV